MNELSLKVTGSSCFIATFLLFLIIIVLDYLVLSSVVCGLSYGAPLFALDRKSSDELPPVASAILSSESDLRLANGDSPLALLLAYPF